MELQPDLRAACCKSRNRGFSDRSRKNEAGRVAARPGEAVDEAKLTGSSLTPNTIGIVAGAALAAIAATRAAAPPSRDRPCDRAAESSNEFPPLKGHLPRLCQGNLSRHNGRPTAAVPTPGALLRPGLAGKGAAGRSSGPCGQGITTVMLPAGRPAA